MTDELGWHPPAKASAIEEQKRKEKLMRDLLNLPTRELFIGALRLQGIAEGSEAWRAALAAWTEYQQKRG